MSFLYNLAYTIFGIFYAPFFPARLSQAEDPARLWSERRGIFYQDRLAESRGKPIISIQAVSVGEVMAVKSFVKGLLERTKNHILITTVTPTGQKIAETLKGPRVSVTYAPFDMSWMCRRFLKVF